MGMTRSRSHYLLGENDYLFMLNGQSIDESGNSLSLSNEHSNILASVFKAGFKVLNFNNDVISNTTYYFLTNPTTRVSEIGKIYNKKDFTYPDDTESNSNCTDCIKKLDLSTPLENQTQLEHQVYETILTDDCNLCLNFDVNKPIVSILKKENVGTILGFAQEGTPPRYLELDNIEQYTIIDPDTCVDGDEISTCLDCEKLRIFKLYETPSLNDFDKVLGGTLKKGAYEAFFAYTDETGEELSSYIPLNYPISIFNDNDIKFETDESLTRTNFAIRFSLSNIDKRFTHYKVAVIYNTAQTISETTQTSFIQGIHSTSNSSFTVTNNTGVGNISINKILIPKPSVDSWRGLGTSNGILFGTGVKYSEEINLQPVINLMGLGLKWQSTIAKEDLYSKAVGNQYKGYNRDEVQSFGFQPISKDGYQYPIYPIIPRIATTDERSLAVVNQDTNSLLQIVDSCNENTRTEKWQFYNTAIEEGTCAGTQETVSLQQDIEAITQTILPVIVAGSIDDINVPTDYDYIDLKNYLNDFKDSLCATPTGSFITLCPLLDVNSYNVNTTIPDDVQDAVCDGFIEIDKDLKVTSVLNEQSVFTYFTTSEIEGVKKPNNVQIYYPGGSLNDPGVDYDFSYTYNADYVVIGPDEFAVPLSFKRYDNYSNTSVLSSQVLQKVTNSNITSFTGVGYFHANLGVFDIADLKTTISMPVSVQVGSLTTGIFTDKLHKGALWFNTTIDNREEFYINISKKGSCTNGAVAYRNISIPYTTTIETLRVSIFDSNTATAPLYSEIINVNVDNFITIDSAIINNSSSNNIYVSIEAAIIEKVGYGEDWQTTIQIPENGETDPVGTLPTIQTFILEHTCGAWNIADRDREIKSVDVTYDNIEIIKNQYWTNNCILQIPKVQDCKPVPFKYGKFGYYESIEKYPCNSELYDSSTLQISPSDLTNTDFKINFENDYVSSIGADYVLNSETNFQNKNIRHPKLPDNKISPFMAQTGNIEGVETLIYPLGVTIDNEIINNLLDVAVKNNLLSQDKRDMIVGYKIYRGDTTLERSVLTSGLMFDMKRALKNNKEYLFSNFPYNAQGEDKIFNNITPTTQDNYLFSFNSPESEYFKINTPTEFSIQGYQQGVTKGYFDEVRDHQKMTILGNEARTLASTLAVIEALAEITISLTQGAEVYRVGLPLSPSINPIGIGFHIAALIISGLQGLVFNVGKYRYEWLKIFKDLGRPENFGYYYSSVADLSTLNTSYITDGERLRGMSTAKHMESGLLTTVDKGLTEAERFSINNIDREKAIFISTSKDFKITHPTQHYEYDNNTINPYYSSQPIASEFSCLEGLSDEFNRRVSIPYVALKNYISDQYKSINSIKWIDTHYKGDLSVDNNCDFILGGDTFISRHSIKRKVKIFKSDGFGAADNTPINYQILSNISDAKYYIDYEATKDESIGGTFFPDINYEIQTDCGTSNSSFYLKPPSKFYLYYYGQPNFLCESRVNTNYRNSNKEPWEEFYPANKDFMEYTQEKVVSIQRPNSYFYSGVFSYDGTSFNNYTLSDNFSKEVSLLQSDNPNNIMYSKKDANDNSITEPWLVYKPNDSYVFPAKFGKLQSLKGIESDQVLAVLENTTAIYNAVDSFVNGLSDSTQDLGTGGIFAKRIRTFSDTDLGYIGSQSKQVLSTEFGHYIVDPKRGQVFTIFPGGQSFEEISRYSNKKPNGMDVWFKEHLPFKIVRDFPEFDKLDNPYNGIGISMGWDSKYRRLFITKKDYIKNTSENLIYNPQTEFFESDASTTLSLQDVINQNLLKEVSWTITYKPEKGAWESYMSFYPNYYVAHTDYFQTGYNNSGISGGLWSHLLTNRSKQVFNGVLHPWIVEFPTKNEYRGKKLEAVSFYTESKRYQNEYDFASDDRITFNKAVVYSDRENSHLLNLTINNGTLQQLSNYPKTNGNLSQDVLITQDNNRWNLNHIWNRVKSNRNNQVIWNWDVNQINKTINPEAVSFYGKPVLESMSSDLFIVRLIQDKTSQYDQELRFAEIKTEQII